MSRALIRLVGTEDPLTKLECPGLKLVVLSVIRNH